MRISLLAIVALVFCGALGFCCVNVTAQERGEFDPAQMLDRIFEDDNDGDGKIAKDEATERLQARFETIDTDKDGFLTREEVTEMFAQRTRVGDGFGLAGGRGGMQGRGGQEGPGGGRGGQGGGRGGQGGGPGRLLAMMPVIVALDINQDGELSAAEIAGAVAALKTLDKDADGKISSAEMAPDFSQMNRGGQAGAGAGAGAGGRGGEGGGQRPRRPAFDVDDDE
jgi:hypothetical protein